VASIVDAFGGCRVIEQLSSGPLSDVYHAVQEPLGRHVAIKALRPAMMPGSAFAAPLVREAKLLSSLHHPNILELYDFVRTEDAMWLVLEYVDGVTLAELVAKAERLAPESALSVALSLANALEHAHARGVVHRDVKPANVLVSRRGEVKLVDFGIAYDERLPSSPEPLDGGSTFGTPAYMSPEQILGEPVDGRTDIFSLGIVLFQLLAGVRPFDAPDSKTVAQRIRQEPTPSLRGRVPNLPRAIERIVVRCLEKTPGDRYGSAGELAQALDHALRELTPAPTGLLISEALLRAKVIEAVAAGVETGRPNDEWTNPTGRRSVFSALQGYLALLALLVLGGGFIQHEARKGEDPVAATHQGPLELLPLSSGSLKVLAHPWAEIVIDGQLVDTTPIGKPIPLSAGTHYVTFRHPKAPEERRVVRIGAGETLVLDVNMQLTAGASGKPSDGGGSHANAAAAPGHRFADMIDDPDSGDLPGL
jgi:serine/threonine-protein kinase